MDADFAGQLAHAGASQPVSERHAALALHSMTDEDRRWLLGRLPAARRERVQRLLDELQALSVPAQPQWMRASCLAPRTEDAPVPASRATAGDTAGGGSDGSLDALHRLPASAAHRLLAGEPDGLIADVLRLGPFGWQSQLLGLMPARRAAIESLLRTPRPTPAVARRAALVRGLAARAAALAPAPHVVPREKRRSGLVRWLPDLRWLSR